MPDLWLFVLALCAVYLVPGPDMILVLQTAALEGRLRALAAALGLALGRAAHVTLAVLGLAALFRAAPWTFELVRYAGAAYLLWLGVGLLRLPSLVPAPAAGAAPPGARGSLRRSLRRGLLTNSLNPKALLFCSGLLPQFLRPAEGAFAAQVLLLGAVLVGLGMAFDGLFALLGAALGRAAARHPAMDRIQRGLFGTVLIAFALRLAL